MTQWIIDTKGLQGRKIHDESEVPDLSNRQLIITPLCTGKSEETVGAAPGLLKRWRCKKGSVLNTWSRELQEDIPGASAMRTVVSMTLELNNQVLLYFWEPTKPQE